MNASTRGIMYVKADRIVERINKAKVIYEKETDKNINDFVKAVETIIYNELTNKGVDRQWAV